MTDAGPDVREISVGQTALAYPAMEVLRGDRPAVGSLEEFVERIDTLQRPEGYRLVGAFEPDDPAAAAVAGFRLAHSTAWGRFLYVDDLVTRPECRRRGHASALLAFVDEEGRRLGCDAVHLDSGHHRTDAHRLYLALGFEDIGRHFARWVST